MSALREVRSCAELLARLRAQLESGTKVQVGVALVERQEERVPENMAELEVKIAAEIGRLTNGYDPSEIERLKVIASTIPQLPAPVIN
jgi:hypothetical protein